jgi:hypothetical protein
MQRGLGRGHLKGDRTVLDDLRCDELVADLLHDRVDKLPLAHKLAEEIVLELLLLGAARLAHAQDLVAEVVAIVEKRLLAQRRESRPSLSLTDKEAAMKQPSAFAPRSGHGLWQLLYVDGKTLRSNEVLATARGPHHRLVYLGSPRLVSFATLTQSSSRPAVTSRMTFRISS